MPKDDWSTLRAEMSAGEAQREVRADLREAREQLNLSRERVAGLLGWSLLKVLRAEQGARPVSLGDLQRLIGIYGIQANSERLTRLTAHAIERHDPI